MRKNKKGMTSIEFLAAFAIISVIVVGLFDVVLNYKNRQQEEAVYAAVTAYANSLQKVIQDDLIKNRLSSVSISGKTATLGMKNTSSKTLSITAGSYNSSMSVVSVGSIKYNNINYPLPDIEDLTVDSSSSITTETENENNYKYLKIHIALRHANFLYRIDESEYGIYDFDITCPINYSD